MVSNDVMTSEEKLWLVWFYKLIVTYIIHTNRLQSFKFNQRGRQGNRLFEHVSPSDESLAFYIVKAYAEDGQDEIVAIVKEWANDKNNVQLGLNAPPPPIIGDERQGSQGAKHDVEDE